LVEIVQPLLRRNPYQHAEQARGGYLSEGGGAEIKKGLDGKVSTLTRGVGGGGGEEIENWRGKDHPQRLLNS